MRRGTEQVPLYGVDTMLFVYHFEAHPHFGSAAGRLLAAVEAGRCRLVVSVLALLEALVIPKRQGDEVLCRRYRDFFDAFPNLTVVPVGPEVAEAAAELRASHGLRTPDALHLATARHAGADLFVTEDRRVRELPDLAVRSLAEVT
jgi:predicted nucleic acid-binding protein